MVFFRMGSWTRRISTLFLVHCQRRNHQRPAEKSARICDIARLPRHSARMDHGALQRARKEWLSGSSLDAVESVYLQVWKSKEAANRVEAGEKLALLYLQSGRAPEADEILEELGYACRLAQCILSCDTSPSSGPSKLMDEICCAYDGFLSCGERRVLDSVFSDPASTYWTENNYSVEPPSPYFSFIVPLDDLENFGVLGSIIHRIRDQLLEWKPVLSTCGFVELWAHNRPHATGHQLHFDSDNEGRDNLRHPAVSTILYLSPEGGPSLITNQRHTSKSLATMGCCMLPKLNRLVAFDGRVLHGVIPGKGVSSTRRVTLMLAFWKQIQVRDGTGAARPFPREQSWARQLVGNVESSTVVPTVVKPNVLRHVYEDLGGEPRNRRMGMPDYEQVYQGF